MLSVCLFFLIILFHKLTTGGSSGTAAPRSFVHSHVTHLLLQFLHFTQFLFLGVSTARQSSAEAQAFTRPGRRVGQHVPFQWRGWAPGALHGGGVYGDGGPGELRAQVQGKDSQK